MLSEGHLELLGRSNQLRERLWLVSPARQLSSTDGAVASRPLHRAADFNPLAVRRVGMEAESLLTGRG